MDKVGIARGLFYYYDGEIWKDFFDYLGVDYVLSPKTNKDIMKKGADKANDEMCLALKTYLGHISYLEDKCDCVLVPRIDNFGSNNQTCTNFISAYDIVKNVFGIKVISYNIDLEKGFTLKKGLVSIGLRFGKKKREVLKAYKYACDKYLLRRMNLISNNMNKLNSNRIKILIVSHPYNINDELIGKEIVTYLEENGVDVIFSDRFDDKHMNSLSKELSSDLYFKYSKDNLGSLVYCKDKVNGVIFISAFPCGPDSLANELAMRKIKLPYINLVLDDNSSFTGTETRLESFVDMLKGDFND